MKRLHWWLLSGLVAACSPSRPPEVSGEAYCKARAQHDPEVVKLTIENMSAGAFHPDISPDVRLAQLRAMQKCLRAEGIAPPGGVEPVIPRLTGTP